jgi:tRNA A37 methylthiotransferase MiaB
VLEVLGEGASKREGMATMRSRTGKLVHVAGDHQAGSFLQVRIVSAAQHHLVGAPV